MYGYLKTARRAETDEREARAEIARGDRAEIARGRVWRCAVSPQVRRALLGMVGHGRLNDCMPVDELIFTEAMQPYSPSKH